MEYELFVTSSNGYAFSTLYEKFNDALEAGRMALKLGAVQSEIHNEDGCYDLTAEVE